MACRTCQLAALGRRKRKAQPRKRTRSRSRARIGSRRSSGGSTNWLLWGGVALAAWYFLRSASQTAPLTQTDTLPAPPVTEMADEEYLPA